LLAQQDLDTPDLKYPEMTCWPFDVEKHRAEVWRKSLKSSEDGAKKTSVGGC
jgi:hypothetical protein